MTEAMTDCRRDAGAGEVSPDEDELRIRGLLHDLGHQMMTLSLLTEAVRADSAMPDDSRDRMKLVVHEMFRAMDLIADVAPGPAASRPGGEARITDVRHLATEVAQLADLAHETAVATVPGPAARLQISPRLLWRVLTNLVGNAVRAAGPSGSVRISIEQRLGTVIEVSDDGPGFGCGPGGSAGLGMSVVRQLLDTAGGRLEIADRVSGGTCARVIFGFKRE